jgi:hypothetical protein
MYSVSLFLSFIYEWVKYSLRRICCFIFDHTWTSLPELDIEPTQSQIDKGAEGYKEYTRSFCKICGKKIS